jgi:hypothetical protein
MRSPPGQPAEAVREGSVFMHGLSNGDGQIARKIGRMTIISF